MLAERVLPRLLAGMAEHPKPQSFAKVVYRSLAESLEAVAPQERLSVVERADLEAQIKQIRDGALSLAVARYVRDNPAAAGAASSWLGAGARAWSARAAEEIGAEATQRLEQLDGWEQRVQDEAPEVWEVRRVEANHSRLALQSARSGSFSSAAGPLADFLSAAGAPVERLDIS